MRNASKVAGVTIQPLPQAARHALTILTFLTLLFLFKTLPMLAPENLFHRTQSRLQIPTDTLFNRVASLRPANALTAADQVLRGKFVNLESRLLYLQFGPSVMADCPFCNADEPKSYLYFAIPAMLWPHLANLVAIAVVTSPTWTSRYGGQWRAWATIGAGLLAAADVYLTSTYRYQGNARALRLVDLDCFYWTARNMRHIALAALDALLGVALYLSATNRAFVRLPSSAERVEIANRELQAVRSKLSALGIIKNTAQRDEDLRRRSDVYWGHEVRLTSEVMEEREVIEGVNDALSNRLNIANITRDADSYAESVMRVFQEAEA